MAKNSFGRFPIGGDEYARLDAEFDCSKPLVEETYNEVSALRNLTSEGVIDRGINTESTSAGNGHGMIPNSSPSDAQPIVSATFAFAGKTAFGADDGEVMRVSGRIPLPEETVGKKTAVEAEPAIDGTCAQTEERTLEELYEIAETYSEQSGILYLPNSRTYRLRTTCNSGESTDWATTSPEHDGCCDKAISPALHLSKSMSSHSVQDHNHQSRQSSRSLPSFSTLSQENAYFWRETSKRKVEERAMYSEMRGRSKLGDLVTKSSRNYGFVCHLIHGIRSSVTNLRCDAVEGEAAELGPKDFDAFTKFEYVLDGNHRCKFKDYAPAVFRQMRKMFGVDDEAYLDSVGHKEGLTEISTEETGSKSGQKFLISHDGLYFMKTATASEARFFMKMLPDYYRHMKDHPNSLLCRFAGVHRLKPGKSHVLVMANVFDTERVIHQRFDLKGSTLGRRVSEADRRAPTVILKDLNFLQEEKSISLGPGRKSVLMTQIMADSSFLCNMSVMDYSLLLGVHYRNQEQQHADLEKTSTGNARDADVGRATSRIAADATKTSRSISEDWRLVRTASLESFTPAETHVSHFQIHDGGLASEDISRSGMGITGEEIYFVGIIDILQHYNWRKRSETFFKSCRHNLAEISAVDPQSYRDRFCDFMRSLMV